MNVNDGVDKTLMLVKGIKAVFNSFLCVYFTYFDFHSSFLVIYLYLVCLVFLFAGEGG